MWIPFVLAAGFLRVAAYPANPQPVDAVRQPWHATVCFADVGRATYSLGEVSTLINAAVIACPKKNTSDERLVCSANLGNMMAALLYVISYTSSALVDCVNQTNIDTSEPGCAADISGFMNGLVTAWGAASSLASGSCRNITRDPLDGDRRLSEAPTSAEATQAALAAAERLQRRLGARKRRREVDAKQLPLYNQYKFLQGTVPDYDQFILDMSEKDNAAEISEEVRVRNTDISFCVLDIGQATFYLTRAIAALHNSLGNCKPSELTKPAGQMGCTVSIAGMLGFLLYVSLYISYATSQCPATTDQRALCSGDIISSMTVITSLTGSAASLDLTCGHLPSVKAAKAAAGLPVDEDSGGWAWQRH